MHNHSFPLGNWSKSKDFQTEREGDVGPGMDHGHRQPHNSRQDPRERVHPGNSKEGLPFHGVLCRGEEHMVPGTPVENICTKETL